MNEEDYRVANQKLFIGGLAALIVGLPLFLSPSWFGYPFAAAGLSLMVFSGSRSVLARYGFGRDLATLAAGVVMFLQILIVHFFPEKFGIYTATLSFGVGFCGLIACLVVIIPALRGLRGGTPIDH